MMIKFKNGSYIEIVNGGENVMGELREADMSDIDWFCNLTGLEFYPYQKVILWLQCRTTIRRMRQTVETLRRRMSMSTYCKEKVLRFPMDGDLEDFEELHSEYFDYCTPGMFQIAPTCEGYIDLVLSYEYDCDGEYGKTRALTENEKRKYEPIWQKIIPNIDMERVRLVEFCWYNGTEAPDYYDDVDDPFYTEEV